MGIHEGNWWSFIRYDAVQDRPRVSRALLRRVARHARPYLGGVVVLLAMSGISYRPL